MERYLVDDTLCFYLCIFASPHGAFSIFSFHDFRCIMASMNGLCMVVGGEVVDNGK